MRIAIHPPRPSLPPPAEFQDTVGIPWHPHLRHDGRLDDLDSVWLVPQSSFSETCSEACQRVRARGIRHQSTRHGSHPDECCRLILSWLSVMLHVWALRTGDRSPPCSVLPHLTCAPPRGMGCSRWTGEEWREQQTCVGSGRLIQKRERERSTASQRRP